MRILSLLFVLLACAGCVRERAGTASSVITPADLRVLEGAPWGGELVYRDYSNGREVSIPARMLVTAAGGDPRGWTLEYQYPDEPAENSVRQVVLSADGRVLDGEVLLERSRAADGTVVIITRQAGRDNDRDAELRFAYRIAPRRFSITKTVRYMDEAEFFERHRYVLER